MKLSMIREIQLAPLLETNEFNDSLTSYFPEDLETDSDLTDSSLEALNFDLDPTSLTSSSNEAYPVTSDEPPSANAPERREKLKCRTLPYTRVIVKETNGVPAHVAWTFFLNQVELGPISANTFCMLMNTIKPEDQVVIQGPTYCPEPTATALLSMIETCASRNITIHSPYCLNTGATLFHTVGANHTLSPYMYARITPPVVFGYGAHLDSKNSMEYGTKFYHTLYQRLIKYGLLTTEEYELIMSSQKAVSIWGAQWLKRLHP